MGGTLIQNQISPDQISRGWDHLCKSQVSINVKPIFGAFLLQNISIRLSCVKLVSLKAQQTLIVLNYFWKSHVATMTLTFLKVTFLSGEAVGLKMMPVEMNHCSVIQQSKYLMMKMNLHKLMSQIIVRKPRIFIILYFIMQTCLWWPSVIT